MAIKQTIKSNDKSYKKSMTATYKDIYKDIYNLDQKTINYTSKIIKKNLREMKVSLKKLREMNVLNVGTGLESVVFHKLGAKKVYHCDISKVAVDSIKKHKQKFKRLETKEIDLCSEKLILQEKVDLIYLCGVFHHFNKPKFALQNLINNLNFNGVIYIRNYRSGSIYFFVTDFIRKFFPPLKAKILQKILKKNIQQKFSRFKIDNKYHRTNYLTYLYNGSIDNYCVPTLNLFNANKFNEYFKNYNFKNLIQKKYPDYYHKDFSRIDLLMQTFIFKNLNKKKIKLKSSFLKSSNQLNINYKEDYIKKTVRLMKKKIPIIKKYNLEKKINLLIDLQYICNIFRYQKFYGKVKHKYFRENMKKLSNIEGIHELLILRLNHKKKI